MSVTRHCHDVAVTHQGSSYAGRVVGLRRYPVKSLVGELLERVEVDARGVLGDRLWAVRDPDGKLGSGKSTRRFRKMDGLLALAARYDADTPVIELPDGRAVRGDDPDVHETLSDHVGRPVRLAREEETSHFDEGPSVHLVTTSTLAALGRAHDRGLDPARFRPNLVVETDAAGFVEDRWVGRRLGIGPDVVLEVRGPMPRCVMVTLAQVGLDAEHGLFRTVTEVNDGQAGVVADVVSPGAVSAGDRVHLLG